MQFSCVFVPILLIILSRQHISFISAALNNLALPQRFYSRTIRAHYQQIFVNIQLNLQITGGTHTQTIFMYIYLHTHCCCFHNHIYAFISKDIYIYIYIYIYIVWQIKPSLSMLAYLTGIWHCYPHYSNSFEYIYGVLLV